MSKDIRIIPPKSRTDKPRIKSVAPKPGEPIRKSKFQSFSGDGIAWHIPHRTGKLSKRGL